MVKSFARFTPFWRGRIVGQAEAGEPRKNIRKNIRKKDGSCAGMRAIDALIAHGKDKKYDGEDSKAGGRPRELTEQEEALLKKLIIDEVGLARVTIQYCQKRLKFLRRLSKEGACLALHRLGLAWRLRRAKTAIPKKHVAARCPRLSLRSVCGQSAAQSAASLRPSPRQHFLLVFIKGMAMGAV